MNLVGCASRFRGAPWLLLAVLLIFVIPVSLAKARDASVSCPASFRQADVATALSRGIKVDPSDVPGAYRQMSELLTIYIDRCRLPQANANVGRTEIAEFLFQFNRLDDADRLAAEVIARLEADKDDLGMRALGPRLLWVRTGVAAQRKDTAGFVKRLADYDALIARSPYDAGLGAEMARYQKCLQRDGLRLGCREGEETILFGQYAVRPDVTVEGQCPTDTEIFSEKHLGPGGQLEAIAIPARSMNRACALEIEIGDIALRWLMAVDDATIYQPGNSARYAEVRQLGEQLLAKLDDLAIAIDGFDRPNPISRFQPRALAMFVSITLLRMDVARDPAKLNLPPPPALKDRFAALMPFYEAAIGPIIDGDAGFLRTDTIGLAAFTTGFARQSPEKQAETIWRLLHASFGPSDLPPPSLAEVRAGLADGESLVAVVHAMDGTGVMMVTQKGGDPMVAEVDVSVPLAGALGKLLLDSVADTPTADGAFPLNASRILYAQYICQAELLGAKGPLVIVPDTVLERIPFPLLARPEVCNRQEMAEELKALNDQVPISALSNVEWLSARHPFRMMPVRGRLERKQAVRGRPYLGVGAPQSAVEQQRFEMDGDILPVSNDRLVFRELEYALPEMQRTAALLRRPTSELLSGAQATEGRVRSEIQRAPPAILHFATHALDPAAFPSVEDPLLILTSPAAGVSAGDDGELTAQEVRTLSLPGSRVVLSACRTAAARAGLGEGIFSGLVAAFFDAGASEVVATYWVVDDPAAAELAPQIISRMASGAAAGEAVAVSQKRFRDKQARSGEPLLAHPYFWASYVVATPYGSGYRP